MNYYDEIKETLIKNEIYKKVKDYSKNKSDLNAYFEVGRLIVEAQGGEKRAKYGNKLIKEYSEKLTKELGKGYKVSNLKNMRQIYLKFRKRQTLSGEFQHVEKRGKKASFGVSFLQRNHAYTLDLNPLIVA